MPPKFDTVRHRSTGFSRPTGQEVHPRYSQFQPARRWASRAEAEDTLARRQHLIGDVADRVSCSGWWRWCPSHATPAADALLLGLPAPNATLPAMVVRRRPEAPTQAEPPADGEASCAHHRPVRPSWASLLKHVFGIDLAHCPNCGGALKIIAAILEQPVMRRSLRTRVCRSVHRRRRQQRLTFSGSGPKRPDRPVDAWTNPLTGLCGQVRRCAPGHCRLQWPCQERRGLCPAPMRPGK